MAQLEIVLPGGQAVPLGDKPVAVGRGPSNEVALDDDTVSWHHAQLWVEGGAPWVRDLGSRNGTFVNGERITGALKVAVGDAIRIGATVELAVRGMAASAVFRSRHVEDLGRSDGDGADAAGVRILVRGDRFLLGSAPGCDLRVDGWPARAATIIVHDNGELWVGTDEGEWQVEPAEEFVVLGRRLRVVEDAVDHAPTVDWGSFRYPYVVAGTGNAPGGPQVVLTDPATGRETLLTGNRGVLLYVLARKLVKDREANLTPSEEGWCGTDEVLVGVWGKGQKAANHLNVLVHRLRGQLQEEGYDPWFVEKRRGAIRIRVREVTVT
jgi:hypothetical protein